MKVTNKTIIGVGSNIQPEKNIKAAEKILADEHQLLGTAQVIQTSPEGFVDQDDFLNTAFYIETALAKDSFNLYLKEVEKRLKRVKGPIKAGPRTIDLDIVVWNNQVVDDDFYNKEYVRQPVSELITSFNLKLQEST